MVKDVGASLIRLVETSARFDARVALECARLHRRAIVAGRTSMIEESMIAAMCACRDATLATRNVKDFDYLGVRLVNPFEG